MLFGLALTTLLVTLVAANPVVKRQEARVITSCSKPNTAALTFDDGPWYYLYDVSKALVAANATGTFFFNGDNYGCIYDPDNVKRVLYALDKGHQLASHTWHHKDLATLTWDQIHDQMWRVEQALSKIAGVTPAFMRPPFGSYNDLVRKASYARGQVIATWDFDSGDTAGASAAESKSNYDKLIANRPNSILALNHETVEGTAHNVLPYVIGKLQAAGYKLVSLAECTGLPAYQSQTAPGVRDDTWKC